MSLQISRIAMLLTFAALQLAARPEKRFEYELPAYQQINDAGLSVLAVSPDGRQFAYCTTGGIYICSGNPLIAKLLPGTHGAPVQPFFSPDGKWLGYFSQREGLLKKIALEGADPFPLRNTGPVSGAHWVRDDSIIFSRNGRSMVQMSANGKNLKVLFDVPSGLAVYPQLLPDGDSLLYTLTQTGRDADPKICVRSIKSGQERTIWAGSKGQYLASGHLVYKTSDNSVMSVPFDLQRMEATGAPVTLAQNVWNNGSLQFAVSGAGTVVYIPESPGKITSRQSNLAWVTREGKEERLDVPADRYSYAKLSPDATRLALTIADGERRGIWIWDLIGKKMTRLSEDANAGNSFWTLDGRYVVYRTAQNKTNFDIVRKLWDGTGGIEKLASIPQKDHLFYSARTDTELTILNMPGTNNPYPPQVSPDGRWIAYTSDETGKNEVYVSPFPELTQRKCVISVAGGTNPLWSPDGREIFYRYAEAVISIPIQTAPVLRTGKPLSLFWMPDASASQDSGAPPPGWDISPDGKRFLVIKAVEKYRKIVVLAFADRN